MTIIDKANKQSETIDQLVIKYMTKLGLPIVLLPDVVFTDFPIGLIMEGQYIFKNLVIIGAALVVGSTVNARAKTKASEGASE